MEKPFLTYNQQMRHLRNEKGIECSGTNDKIMLCRYGYFNLVNGYKNPFINGKDENGNRIYYKGTKLMQLNHVKEFDENLRFLLLKYVVRAEEEARVFAAYKFDEVNLNCETTWYQVEAYGNISNIKDVIGFISKAYSEISRSELEYVKFYMSNHKVIPTWILVKVINFSTFISFVHCAKPEIKDSLCNLYGMINERGFYNHKYLIGSLHLLRKVRNSCAHNERIYDMRRSKGRIIDVYFEQLPKTYQNNTKEQRIIDLLVCLKYYLAPEDYIPLITGIKTMLLNLKEEILPNAFENVRAAMGIKDISHLDLLIEEIRVIEYNKF